MFVCLPKIKAVGFPQNIKLLSNVEGQRNLNTNISDRSLSIGAEHLQHTGNSNLHVITSSQDFRGKKDS